MKYTVNNQVASLILNEGFVPASGVTETEDGHQILAEQLQSRLLERAKRVGIRSMDGVGEVYLGFQNDHLLRTELLSWRMLKDGLIEDLAAFLRANAPTHAIVMTFDFQDDPERGLECPFIVVFAEEAIGGFELCDLDDTQTLLGFAPRPKQNNKK